MYASVDRAYIKWTVVTAVVASLCISAQVCAILWLKVCPTGERLERS